MARSASSRSSRTQRSAIAIRSAVPRRGFRSGTGDPTAAALPASATAALEERSNTTASALSAARTTYRHGDLRRALLDAGIELARAGGPEAVVLREATRRAGVAPNAAYRHFANRQDLLVAVRMAAVAEVAKAMEAELARVGDGGTPAARARAQVRAIGTGYLRFAIAEPGLFRMAFGSHFFVQRPVELAASEYSAHNPFAHLSAALDAMVATGTLPASRRADAEYLAWSTVHGLALLVLDGPLGALPPAQIESVAGKLFDLVDRGL